MPCEERDRLNLAYVDAIGRVTESGKNVLDMKSPEWKFATRAARSVAKVALVALNVHRKDHGC
jgi:hypothetical protein